MKISVISPSRGSLDHIGQILDSPEQQRSLSLNEGGMSRLRAVADQQRPDLIIIEGMCRDVDELGPLEYVTMHYPQTMVLMLCANQSPEFLINAMRAGVKEVLPSPAGADSLRAAVSRAETRLGGAVPRPPGRVLAFIACKGGSGATFLATNLGYQLSTEGKKVLMIDCNLQFGDAVLFLHDQKPATNLADIARNAHRLDASFLAASLIQINDNYGVLAAPEDPGQAMEVKPEHLDALLNVAVSHYDFVIVDIGRILDAVTLRVLDKANTIYPVLQTTLPFIRDANRLLSVFRSLGYPPEKIRPLVNRYEKGGDFTLEDIEQAIGVGGLRTLPNSYATVAASVNRGTPVAQTAKGNAVAKSIAEFAQSLLPKEENPGGGWLGKFLKRA